MQLHQWVMGRKFGQKGPKQVAAKVSASKLLADTLQGYSLSGNSGPADSRASSPDTRQPKVARVPIRDILEAEVLSTNDGVTAPDAQDIVDGDGNFLFGIKKAFYINTSWLDANLSPNLQYSVVCGPDGHGQLFVFLRGNRDVMDNVRAAGGQVISEAKDLFDCMPEPGELDDWELSYIKHVEFPAQPSYSFTVPTGSPASKHGGFDGLRVVASASHDSQYLCRNRYKFGAVALTMAAGYDRLVKWMSAYSDDTLRQQYSLRYCLVLKVAYETRK